MTAPSNITFYGPSTWSSSDTTGYSCTLSSVENSNNLTINFQCPHLTLATETVIVNWMDSSSTDPYCQLIMNVSNGYTTFSYYDNDIFAEGTLTLNQSGASTKISGTLVYSAVPSFELLSTYFSVQSDANSPITSASMYPTIRFNYASYADGVSVAGSSSNYNYCELVANSSETTEVTCTFAFPEGVDMSAANYQIVLQDDIYNVTFNFVGGQIASDVEFFGLPMTISSPQTYDEADGISYVTITGTLNSLPSIPIMNVQGTISSIVLPTTTQTYDFYGFSVFATDSTANPYITFASTGTYPDNDHDNRTGSMSITATFTPTLNDLMNVNPETTEVNFTGNFFVPGIYVNENGSLLKYDYLQFSASHVPVANLRSYPITLPLDNTSCLAVNPGNSPTKSIFFENTTCTLNLDENNDIVLNLTATFTPITTGQVIRIIDSMLPTFTLDAIDPDNVESGAYIPYLTAIIKNIPIEYSHAFSCSAGNGTGFVSETQILFTFPLIDAPNLSTTVISGTIEPNTAIANYTPFYFKIENNSLTSDSTFNNTALSQSDITVDLDSTPPTITIGAILASSPLKELCNPITGTLNLVFGQ